MLITAYRGCSQIGDLTRKIEVSEVTHVCDIYEKYTIRNQVWHKINTPLHSPDVVTYGILQMF